MSVSDDIVEKQGLVDVSDAVNNHEPSSYIGFLFYDLLCEYGYSLEEIEDAAKTMLDIVG